MADKLTEREMSELRVKITGACNSQLKQIIEFAEHELMLSEKTIKSGFEIEQ